MTIYETKHFVRKLFSTVRIVATMFLARTFGRYEVSVYDCDHGISYAKYHWRGKAWAIPTRSLDDD